MGTAKVQGWLFEYDNTEEFRILRQEIYARHHYYVELNKLRPRIIDAGAHIGLATGYFKWLYPEAEIIAIEPNPRLVPILGRNIVVNQWRGVEVEEGVLAKEWGQVPFYFDKSSARWYSTGGLHKGAWNGKQESWMIQVPGRPLTDYLTEPVDLLKLDIEGAEQAVLQAADSKLQMIKHILMEYHPVKGNALDVIQHLLEKRGFEVRILGDKKRDEGLILVEAELK